jgi:hypothetical protein
MVREKSTHVDPRAGVKNEGRLSATVGLVELGCDAFLNSEGEIPRQVQLKTAAIDRQVDFAITIDSGNFSCRQIMDMY